MRAAVLAPLALLLAAATTLATSVPGLPKCASNCLPVGSLGGCKNLDYNCICSNTAFIANLSCCVAEHCDSADQDTTIQVAQALCKANAGITDLPSTATCASTASSSSSGSGSSSTGTASTTTTPTSGGTSTGVSVESTTSGAAAASQTEGGAGRRLEGAGLGLFVAGVMAAL